MHAAMHQQGAEIHRESTEPTDANSGEPSSEIDISDLTNEIAHDRTMAETASFLCRDEDEVRQKAKELGLLERRDHILTATATLMHVKATTPRCSEPDHSCSGRPKS